MSVANRQKVDPRCGSSRRILLALRSALKQSSSPKSSTAVKPMSGRYQRLLDLTVSLALLIASGAVIWSVAGMRAAPARSTTPSLPIEPLSLKGIATRGSDSAPVAMVVFSDFQCPFCGKFAINVMPGLEAAYVASGKLQLGFRHYPIQRIHPFALKAALAAECARPQMFWDMHDRLFRLGSAISDSTIAAAAGEAKLDRVAFSGCLQSRSVAARVQSDLELAQILGIGSTPTFYLGPRTSDGAVKVVRQIVGNKSLEEFANAIDSLLRQQEQP